MKDKQPNRRAFLQTGAVALGAFSAIKNISAAAASPQPPSSSAATVALELEEITISELQAGMHAGKFTARRLAEIYLARIKEIDPKIRAVIELNPDALQIADALDRDRKRGKLRGALHGIPVLIKDNLDTADRMQTTAGSYALVDAPTPARDAFVVQQMRRAGAVILGKTNLSEWANFRSTSSISGWSGRGGQTNNPYILDKNPCGSSAGTGAAISANLAAVGVGTETNGSIICPATRNGIVGIKPTLGLVSRSGIIPIAHTQDTAGPMARTVADAALLLGAMVGYDKTDAITAAGKAHKNDYAKFLDRDGLRGARLGIARQFLGKDEKLTRIYEAHFAALKDAGATLIDMTFPILYPEFRADETLLLQYEFKTDLNKYLAARNVRYKTLADLIKFNTENKERELPLFGQEIFIASEARGELTDKEYLDALQRLKTATQEKGIDAVIAKDKLDAIVAPASGATWSLAAIAGYPYITVPAGLAADGLPVGIGFFGRAFAEPQLIKIAYAFEQKTKARRKPELLLAAT